MPREHTSDEDFEDDKVVETGPNGTYVRFEHKLGSGAFKTVYRALDTEKGIEVAWNQVLIDRFQLDKEKVLREIEFFKKIRHKHVIEFYNFWTDERKNQVVFITELMPSGTLTDYIKKSPEVKLKIIKSWCRQILLGLNYLHTQDPPIIHRDIKCGNIFINGTTEGEVKIGDLGLATFCLKKDALSVIGTPEFMAPEYYNEVYTTSVDIWAFGMAMIEMVTLQCPYAECDNVGQIFKKVSGGIRPPQLELILDSEVKDFIKLCLADENERPTAAQLLQHPFFGTDGVNDNNPVKIACPQSLSTLQQQQQQQQPIPNTPIQKLPPVGEPVRITIEPPTPERPEVSEPEQFDMHVVGRDGDVLEIKVEMGTAEEDSIIEFTYNLAQDDPKTTAAEMVRSLELAPASQQYIESKFASLVEKNDGDVQTDIPPTSDLADLIDDTLVPNIGYEDSDSIHSEPMLATPSSSKFPAATHKDHVLSDPETVTDLSDLESLIEENNLDDFSHNDNRDLEALLDDEDFLGDDQDLVSDHSFGTRSFDSSPKIRLEDDDTGNSLTSGNSSSSEEEEDEDEELKALIAKHEKEMDQLLQLQADELNDIIRKKKQMMTSKSEGDLDFQQSVQDFYDRQNRRSSEFRPTHTWSPLCT